MTVPGPYAEAAKRYKPERTCILFLAEAPPDFIDRYFYFEDVKRADWLWVALMKALYPEEWTRTKLERGRKKAWLTKFQRSCCWLIDSLKEPISGGHDRRVARISAAAPKLISEVKSIGPSQIVLIKATVHKALFQQFRDANLPVVNEAPLPFPSSGRQAQFDSELRRLIDTGTLRIRSS